MSTSPNAVIRPEIHPWASKIAEYRKRPPKWNIGGLWLYDSLAAVHSLEEQYKSFLVYTLADAMARGVPFLRRFVVTRKHRVGIIQTEMTEAETCPRLEAMYRETSIPDTLQPTDDEFKRKFASLRQAEMKVQLIRDWCVSKDISVVIIDTVNSLLSSYGADPNSELAASQFLEHLQQLRMQTLFVRHDGKPSMNSAMRASNQKMRGSNRLVEECGLVVAPSRPDKRTREVVLEFGKIRSAPERPHNFSVWLDSKDCRLHPVPPIVRILEAGKCRMEQLYTEAFSRFKMSRRSVERHLGELRPYLIKDSDRFGAVYGLNYEAITQAATELAEVDSPTPDSQWYGYVDMNGGEESYNFGETVSANLVSPASRQSQDDNILEA